MNATHFATMDSGCHEPSLALVMLKPSLVHSSMSFDLLLLCTPFTREVAESWYAHKRNQRRKSLT